MVVYNLNHCGISTPQRRRDKLFLIRTLLATYPIVGLQEIHAKNRTEAALFFFDHLECHKFYHEAADGSVNQVILIDHAWYELHCATVEHFPLFRTHFMASAGVLVLVRRAVFSTCT